MGFDEYYKARDIVCDILERDLVGPVEDDETIQGLPTSYYVLGKLYPMKSSVDIESDQDASLVEGSTEPLDAAISLTNQFEPSAMGITFGVSGVAKLNLTVKYAMYAQVDSGEDSNEGREELLYFKRIPHSHELSVDVRKGIQSIALDGEVELHVIVRAPDENGTHAVTATLANLIHADNSKLKNASKTLFQPSITVKVPEGKTFVDIDWRRRLSADPELAELELLYRHAGCYAHGHGCSTMWDTCNGAPSEVSTSIFPRIALRQMMPRPSMGLKVFKMAYLVDAEKADIISELNSFVGQYGSWIDGCWRRIEKLDHRYREAAKRNIARCVETKDRLSAAVALLEMDDEAFHAFRLANEAMLLQWERASIKRGGEFHRDQVSWYPFQLAFILQELQSIAKPECDERSLTDLLWFPTGGGKTEAYLGVAAFCIFLRRLRDPRANGVTVIMRYTLRLLTVQQFERASTMICACEQVRKRNNIGGEEISIGLWVGGSLTPNNMDDANDSLKALQNGNSLEAGAANPVQVTVCPWCGRELSPNDYAIDKTSQRMFIHCPDPECAYHAGHGLPVHIVDDAVYEHTPSLIVATVDKFAQVPKKEETKRLFGIGMEVPAPELIIQDELHLISGPLGTMVGLYESAIERLCTRGNIGPKIIASTATVRNANDQIMSLYAQGHTQFPPQGIDMTDSFFAVEATPEERPTRLYLGMMGAGTTQTNLFIRVLAAMLFATRFLEAVGFSDDVVDAYWTIVGYFCTLRELGATLTATVDSVQTRFTYLAMEKLGRKYPGVDTKQRHNRVLELTSRKNNSEIVEAIHALERTYSAEDRFDAYSFVLATNMISVGVDVSRLDVMVVDSQPKSNSEYIQATSRVGRRNPGLVLTVLNSFRSRDRSHYEQFFRFHNALYKNVESSSVTPFSDRARDRGLHTVFVMLCRYLLDGLSDNKAAYRFSRDLDGVDEIMDYIIERVVLVDDKESESVKEELEAIANEWQERAGTCKLVYWDSRNPTRSLLRSDLDEDRFRAMNSMRNVEPSSNVFVVD